MNDGTRKVSWAMHKKCCLHFASAIVWIEIVAAEIRMKKRTLLSALECAESAFKIAVLGDLQFAQWHVAPVLPWVIWAKPG